MTKIWLINETFNYEILLFLFNRSNSPPPRERKTSESNNDALHNDIVINE